MISPSLNGVAPVRPGLSLIIVPRTPKPTVDLSIRSRRANVFHPREECKQAPACRVLAAVLNPRTPARVPVNDEATQNRNIGLQVLSYQDGYRDRGWCNSRRWTERLWQKQHRRRDPLGDGLAIAARSSRS